MSLWKGFVKIIKPNVKEEPVSSPEETKEELSATGELPLTREGEQPAAGVGLDLDICLQTDLGVVRTNNEDRCVYQRPSDPEVAAAKGIVVIVADGMGGASAGEVASEMAIKVIPEAYYRSPKVPALALKEAVEFASAEIHRTAQSDPALRGMGTTCVAMAVLVPEVFVAYVGDSRIYLLRDNTFYQLTEDHTVVSDMVRKGILTRDQARNHEERNVLSLSMGGRPEITASYWENPMIVRDGDRFLLCSDGLHDLVSDSEMQAIVAASAAHKAVPNLIEAARRAGLVDTEKKDREDLQRRRAALLQGSQTEAIRAQIDELLKDIQDSEARLASAQKTYDELTEKLSNFRTSLTARLVSIRQQQSRLDAYSLDVDAFYEKTRTAAQEICNSKAPDSKQTPPTQGR